METAAQPSKRIGIVASNHSGYVETLFRCMEEGHVAVPLREAEDHPRLQAARVDQVVVPAVGKDWLRREFRSPKTEGGALIAFTSGTEGAPKGVILTHNNLDDVVTRLNTLMQLDDSISEYIGVPVYHSFGFGRCRAIATAGGRFFIPGNGFNPAEIAAMLKQGEINAISAVPSLWRILLTNQDLIGSYGKRVRWIEIGSQYMSRQEKEALKALFPEARIVQHYGLTEASRTTLLEIHATEGQALESVGQVHGSVAIKLSEDGQIAIRGNHVAQGYLIDGTEVQLQDDEGWFLTKDLGSLENGYLYYQGRADDVINCGGLKVHPEALETRVYATIGYSQGLAICRKTDPVRGEGFLVAVTQELPIDQQRLQSAVLQATQELGVNAANAITIVEVDSLPKTATGKIQRKQLAAWYAQQVSLEDPGVEATVSTDRASIPAILCRTLNIRKVQPQDTFVSLGGDSLSYVQLAMDLERYLGYLPAKWEHMTISELEQLVPQQTINTVVETNLFLRFLAICGVVFSHAGLEVVTGGSLLLILLAGLNFARFQGCSLMQGQWKFMSSLLRNILFPYLLLSFAYQAWNQQINPAILLLVGNFQSPEIQYSQSIFYVWFIANLVQCMVLFALPFRLQAVRNFASAFPWKLGLIFLGVGLSTRLLGPYVWDTSHLYNNVPHMLFWLFALGWCIQFAKSKPEKIILTVIIAATGPTIGGNEGLQIWWVSVGSLLLLWLPYITIPTIFKLPVQMIGAAAYYIYLTDMAFLHILVNVLGVHHPLLTAPAALLGGVLISMALQSLQQFLFAKRFQKLDYVDSL